MDTVLRALGIYVALMVVLRGSGHRSLSQITTFDFVLLLILGNATQQGLTGSDFSVTTAVLLVGSLVGIDMTLQLVKQRSPVIERLLDGLPLVIVENGRPLKSRLVQSRVDESDILAAARSLQGLERMEQIKYAVLERNGGISIIPR